MTLEVRPSSLVSCKITNGHFLSSEWYNSTQTKVLEFLDNKQVNVRHFVPESIVGNVRFSVREGSEKEIILDGRPVGLGKLFLIECYGIDFHIEHAIEIFENHNIGMKRDSWIDYCKRLAALEFCKIYLSLISFASFGCFDPYGIKIEELEQDGNEHHHLLSWQDFEDSTSAWIASPIVIPGGLDQFLEWTRCCQGIWDKAASTNVEKAFSFVLNSLHPEEGKSDISRLAWGIAALEAIASENSQEIRGKIVRRIPVLAGLINMKSIRKFLGLAYDFRSRIFHGDIPIYNKVSFFDGPPQGSKDDANEECFKIGMMITAIVIAIVWKCVLNNSYQVKFVEKVELT